MTTKRLLFVSLTITFFVALISGTSIAGEKLFIDGSGGVVQSAYETVFFKAFEKETGIKIIYTATSSAVRYPKAEQMVESGNVQWDIIEADREIVTIGSRRGMFLPIDYSLIETKDLTPSGLEKYGICKGFYSIVIGYNAEEYPTGKPHPMSWKDFWDIKKFPGPRSLRNNPRDNLEFALLADGVPMDKLYPLDVDRAFKSLDKIKPYITVWWTSGAQPAQLLANGEVVMASAWNGRLYNAAKNGAPVGTEWNQGSINFTNWCVLKGTKRKINAMKFLDFFNRDPKRQAKYCEILTYPGLNKKMYDYLDPKLLPHVNMSPQNMKKQFVYNVKWWVENMEKVTERWNIWMLK